MARAQHIDHILRSWKYRPNGVVARVVKGSDGRDLLQMRLELGLLQMEVAGRPDGEQPGGHATYYDYLLSKAFEEGEDFCLDEINCREIDREFVQFYHRRICWLSLQQYCTAAEDADHTLALMDFSSQHSPSDEWAASHEQYRPFVLFQRTQARALAALEDDGAERAMDEINDGVQQLTTIYEEQLDEPLYEEDELIERLNALKDSLREHYNVGPTLTEQLNEAIAREEYERAAELRDEIERRTQ